MTEQCAPGDDALAPHEIQPGCTVPLSGRRWEGVGEYGANAGTTHTGNPHFVGSFIRDPVAAGAEASRLLWTSEALELLGDHGCGWNDGGCAVLAFALAPLLAPLPSRIEAVVAGKGPPISQHVLLRVQAGSVWYLDADGAASKAAVLSRWEMVERISAPRLVPLSAGVLDPDTLQDSAMIKRVRSFLATRLSHAIRPTRPIPQPSGGHLPRLLDRPPGLTPAPPRAPVAPWLMPPEGSGPVVRVCGV